MFRNRLIALIIAALIAPVVAQDAKNQITAFVNVKKTTAEERIASAFH